MKSWFILAACSLICANSDTQIATEEQRKICLSTAVADIESFISGHHPKKDNCLNRIEVADCFATRRVWRALCVAQTESVAVATFKIAKGVCKTTCSETKTTNLDGRCGSVNCLVKCMKETLEHNKQGEAFVKPICQHLTIINRDYALAIAPEKCTKLINENGFC